MVENFWFLFGGVFYGGLIDICLSPYRIHEIADAPAEYFTTIYIDNRRHAHKSVTHLECK
jgi:hypothetical protein